MNLPKKGKSLVNLEVDQFIAPENISNFLAKLSQLKATNGDAALKIVHIGDSHIQMGYFSGEIRSTLQSRFGGMGIGLFFPNSLCSGYNPLGLDITSVSNWQCEKITNLESTIPLGIVGMAMKTSDASSSINVAFKGRKEKVRMFTIFHENTEKTHEIRCKDGIVVTRYFSEKSAMTTVTLNQEMDETLVEFVRKEGIDTPFVLYALSVNNPADHGVDYNTFGVSGGQYKFFAKNTPLLSEQIAAFKPDLMIISLGSNDSYDKKLTPEDYREMLLGFIYKLKAISATTEFILTTPPDTEYGNSKPVAGSVVNQTIREIGKRTGCTVWDFYTIMGGFGSIRKWQKHKLGNKDGLHLTNDGYHLQGQLFTLALARAMEQKYPDNGWLREAEGTVTKTLR